MKDWTTKTLQYGSATIIVNRPVLTKEERAERERKAQRSLEAVLKQHYERIENR